MDSQAFRDMCAVYAMQALITNGARNEAQMAGQAFVMAKAMAKERERIDRDAKRDTFGRSTR